MSESGIEPSGLLADSPLEHQELGLWQLALLVLVQGERRDLEYSLLWSSRLTDGEHTRRDHVMSCFTRLGLVRAGAPHFCLTRSGRAALTVLRMAQQCPRAGSGFLRKPGRYGPS